MKIFTLLKIKELYENRYQYIDTMKKSAQSNAIPVILDLIKEYAKDSDCQ